MTSTTLLLRRRTWEPNQPSSKTQNFLHRKPFCHIHSTCQVSIYHLNKTFIDTEKSRRHSGRLRSLRSHRKSMEKSQPKRKPWWIAAIFVYVLTGTFQTFGSFFQGFRGLFLMLQISDFLEESFHEKWDFWGIFQHCVSINLGPYSVYALGPILF